MFARMLYGFCCLGLWRGECYPFDCERFPDQPTYKLFGTKSCYNEAAKQWSSLKTAQLPRQFSEKSLEQVHKKLSSESCRAVHLYFVSRHAGRFPDASDIIGLNEFAQTLQDKIKQKPIDGELHQLILEWRPLMKPEQDNLITLLGEIEEGSIAKRFKSIYPRLLDEKFADIKLGVTKERRTSQTAVAFLKAIMKFKYPKCDKFHTNDINDPDYNLEAIINNKCYEALEAKYQTKMLAFHEECKAIRSRSSGITIKEDIRAKVPFIKKVGKAQYVQFITDDVRAKLGVDSLSHEEMDHLYNLCKYEVAIEGSSVWCSLFTDDQLKYIDYIEDVSDYQKDLYGAEILAAQTCPLMKDLIGSLTQSMKDNNKIGKQKLESTLYFSHAPVLKRFFAALNLFKDEENFTENAFDEFIARKTPPENRQFRSSLSIPFSGNVAFILYKCANNNFKVVTSANEKPIRIGGCTSEVCDMNQFVEFYKGYLSCDMEKICSGRSN